LYIFDPIIHLFDYGLGKRDRKKRVKTWIIKGLKGICTVFSGKQESEKKIYHWMPVFKLTFILIPPTGKFSPIISRIFSRYMWKMKV